MFEFLRHIGKELKTHKIDYLLICTAGAFFIISLQIFKGERLVEFIILLIFTSFYIIWGLYHHVITNTLQLKNIIEYILIGFSIIFLVKIIIFP